jgi:hypothetical protein
MINGDNEVSPEFANQMLSSNPRNKGRGGGNNNQQYPQRQTNSHQSKQQQKQVVPLSKKVKFLISHC